MAHSERQKLSKTFTINLRNPQALYSDHCQFDIKIVLLEEKIEGERERKEVRGWRERGGREGGREREGERERERERERDRERGGIKMGYL